MIAMLKGEISEKLDNQVIIDVNGVGYGAYVTSEDLASLAQDEVVKIFIYEYVREQAHDLFGFLNRQTLDLFEQLLLVNGVGPKMALNVLSIGPSDRVKQAIASGEVEFIIQANGVGKRVAERIVVDLKDKVGLISIDLAGSSLMQSTGLNINDEAVEALISLGYTSNDATKALSNIDSSLSTEERIKQALKEPKK